LLLASVSTTPWHLFAALGVLSSAGSSLLFTPSIAAIGHFFKTRRGLATGVATTAGPASGVLFPLIVQALFVRVGWAWAARALALVCLAITVAAGFLIRSRLPAAKDAVPHPHARIFRTAGFTPTVVAVVLAQFAAFLPLTYLSSYALEKGFTQAFSFDVVAILNASSVAGRLLGGWWADRIGPFNASMLSSALAAFVCFVLWLPAGGTKPGIAIFAVVFGCASGSGVSLVPVSVGRLCRTQEYGRYYGACYTIASLLSLFAIPIAGRLVKGNGGSYWGLIVTTGLLYVAAAVAFAVARASVVGRRIWVAF
jgi:MFS family permease